MLRMLLPSFKTIICYCVRVDDRTALETSTEAFWSNLGGNYFFYVRTVTDCAVRPCTFTLHCNLCVNLSQARTGCVFSIVLNASCLKILKDTEQIIPDLSTASCRGRDIQHGLVPTQPSDLINM